MRSYDHLLKVFKKKKMSGNMKSGRLIDPTQIDVNKLPKFLITTTKLTAT